MSRNCITAAIKALIGLESALVEESQVAEALVGHPLPDKLLKGGTLSRFRTGAAPGRRRVTR